MWNCSCCCRLWHWPTAVVCSVYSAVSADTNALLFSSHRELYYYVVTGFNQVWCAEAFIQDFTADDDERSEDDDSLVDHCLITETTLRLYCHSTRLESEDWDITETLSNHSSCNWQRKKIVNEKKRLVMCTGWTPRRSGCVIILYSLDKAERNYVSEADQITNTTIDTNRVNQSTSSLYFPQILIQ